MDKKYYNEDTKEICIPEKEVQFLEDGLGCLLYERLKLYKNKIIQVSNFYIYPEAKKFPELIKVDSSNGEKDYGSALLQRSIRTALEMKRRGVKENDIISVCSHNHINSIVPVIAAAFIGAVTANLDPSFSTDDLTHLLNIVHPKIIFASFEAYEKINLIKSNLQCNPEIFVFSSKSESKSFEAFLKKSENEDTFLPTKRSLDELAAIFFSSGTTGLSKGICHNARTIIYRCSYFQYETILIYVSLYWTCTYSCSMWTILNGKTNILCSYFDPATAWDTFAKFQVEVFLTIPFEVSLLLQHKPQPNTKLNLKEVSITGSIACKEHLIELKELLPNTNVFSDFGQTETFVSFDSTKTLKFGKLGSIGIPIPGNTYKILDLETGNALGFNQPGELRIKSEYVTSGYYKNKDKSNTGFDENGFFKTGDVMYYDDDFCFYVVDRIKEMFKYRGFHVVTAKMENIIRKHPGVIDAVVVGIPHIVDENRALAFVIPKANYEVMPKEIEEFANNLLDDTHQIRAGLKIVKEFPKSPSGKKLRRKLKDMYLANEL